MKIADASEPVWLFALHRLAGAVGGITQVVLAFALEIKLPGLAEAFGQIRGPDRERA